MLIDPGVWTGTLAAYADAVEAWDPEADLDGADLQVEVAIASVLARRLVEAGLGSGQRRLELGKYHPRGVAESDPQDIEGGHWKLNRRYPWEKSARWVWSTLIHAEVFRPWVAPRGLYFAAVGPPERDYFGKTKPAVLDTLCFIDLDELVRSWREL